MDKKGENSVNKVINTHFDEGEERQNLLPYWTPDFADCLESWGEGNAWEEIQLLASGCDGKILDIACGKRKSH